jgi:hypothetical protein
MTILKSHTIVGAILVATVHFIYTSTHNPEPTDYDQHDAISFGIAGADERPAAVEDLIWHEAIAKYPTNTDFQEKFVRDAMAGYREARKKR